MPLFDKSPELPRRDLKNILRKTNIKVGQGRQLSPGEKSRIERMDFPKKLGPTISKTEYERTIRNLQQTKTHEPDFTKKVKEVKEIKLLKELEKRGVPQKKPGL